jgi:hypothetical protein
MNENVQNPGEDGRDAYARIAGKVWVFAHEEDRTFRTYSRRAEACAASDAYFQTHPRWEAMHFSGGIVITRVPSLMSPHEIAGLVALGYRQGEHQP